MKEIEAPNREKSLLPPRKLGVVALALAAAVSLTACAEESGGGQGNTQSGGSAATATTMAGGTTMDTTGGTTMATTGGTTMSGTTMSGTTMSGTTSGGTTMATTGGTTMQGGTTQGDAVTDVQSLLVQDPQSLVGREVRISDANVQDVVGDATFFVGPSTGQTVLAAIEGERAGSQADQAVDINPGQTVQLNGTVEQLPSTRGLERFGLNQSEIQDLENQQVYLSITDAQVQN